MKALFPIPMVVLFGLVQSKPSLTTVKILCEKTLDVKSCEDNIVHLIDSKRNYTFQFMYTLSIHLSINEISKATRALSRSLENDSTGIRVFQGCQQYISLALHHLNMSLPGSNGGLSDHVRRFDYRTWLSASDAYLQSCVEDHGGEGWTTSLDRSRKLIMAGISMLSDMDESMKPHELGMPPLPKYQILQEKKGKKRGPDVVVAADGSGKYKTINEAIKAIPLKSGKRFIIYVKAGKYKENVMIDKNRENVMIYGDGKESTIVSGDRSVASGFLTPDTATFTIYGKGFIAKDMGFENTAGPSKGQAVAVLSGSDQSIFFRCRIESYQDTLWTLTGRQFFRECDITGTIDFIFGNAPVVIQNSKIIVKRPNHGQLCTITAQGKDSTTIRSGLVIHNCKITTTDDLKCVDVYLGRPWKPYSTTVIMGSEIEGFINPKGWLPWSGKVAPNTIRYVEYNNNGSGANTAQRVQWKGLSVHVGQGEVREFLVNEFIDGAQWIPSTGIPYN